MRRLLALALPLAFAACGGPPEPPAAALPAPAPDPVLTSAADSVAWRIEQATGTRAAWAAIPLLRMDFHSTTPGDTTPPRPPRRHLWDRRSGDYRLEIARPDSAIVALFNLENASAGRLREGRVFVNGLAVTDTSAARRWLDRAYEAHINDTYWLLAPTKLFDAGVTRSLDPDSSRAGAPVLRLAFAGGIGMTPGDRYWLFPDSATGRLAAWQFHLEGSDGPGPRNRWDRWTAFATPAGDTVRLAPDHVFPTGRILHTDAIAFPATVDATLFTDPAASMP